jgi:hypothetical protein
MLLKRQRNVKKRQQRPWSRNTDEEKREMPVSDAALVDIMAS